METAAIYLRVSTDQQDLQRQLNDINEYCKRNQIEILQQFEEKASGTKKKRKELDNLLQFSIATKVDFVIISELSRLGRTNEILNTIDLLSDNKICLVSIKEYIFTLNKDKSVNANASLLTSVLAGLNKFELETFKYRSTSGGKIMAAKGHFKGADRFLPYGYKRIEGQKKVVINEEEAAIIRIIFEKYASGIGVFRLADYLNSQGYLTKTGLKFRTDLISALIRNTIYKGKRKYKGDIYDIPEFRIIDDETFDKCQKIRKSNHNKLDTHKKYTYLLDNKLIKCNVCGKYYFAIKAADTRSNNQYLCNSRLIKGGNCGNYGVNIDKLDAIISEITFKFFAPLIAENLDTSKIDAEIKAKEEELEQYKTLVTAEDKRESQLIEMALNGFKQDLVNKKLEEINSERSRLSTVIDKLSIEYDSLKQFKKNNFELKNVLKTFKKSGIDKGLLRKIITSIEVEPTDEKVSEHLTAKHSAIMVTAVNGYRILFTVSQGKYYKARIIYIEMPFETKLISTIKAKVSDKSKLVDIKGKDQNFINLLIGDSDLLMADENTFVKLIGTEGEILFNPIEK